MHEDGKAVSTAGSWEAGVDGALPGVLMDGQPVVGLAYRQECVVGGAEDMGEVIPVGERVTVEPDTFEDVTTTQD